ncbi:MAG: hypothetical protein AB7E39_00565 [Endomicrobiaceae bacterium]
MKYTKIKIYCCLFLFSSFICACVPRYNPNAGGYIDTNKPMDSESNRSFEPFYVYEDFPSSNNHYAPSGWMGDVANLDFDSSYTQDAQKGRTCLKIKYSPDGIKQWAGVYWQHPVNNWGDKNGGYNITGAHKLTFWAKGAQGNEVITEVKVGGISGKFSDSDVAWLKEIKLTREWKQYTIDLSKSDLSSISGGFCVVFSKKDNPRGCLIYLDEIRYE